MELRDDRLTFVRVHDSAEGARERARFLTDTPVRFDLEIDDPGERGAVSDALVGREGPLRDRALSFGEQPALTGSRSRPDGPSAAAEPEPLWRLRRRMILDDVRSGALPLLAAAFAVTLAAIGLASLGLEDYGTDCGTWHAAAWVMPTMVVLPPFAAVLMRAGRRRLRHDVFAYPLGSFGFLAFASLFVYGCAVWGLSGRCI